jgi:hypothetical protein
MGEVAHPAVSEFATYCMHLVISDTIAELHMDVSYSIQRCTDFMTSLEAFGDGLVDNTSTGSTGEVVRLGELA